MSQIVSKSLVAILLVAGIYLCLFGDRPAWAAKKNVVISRINGPRGWHAKKVLSRALRGQFRRTRSALKGREEPEFRLVSSRRYSQLAQEQGRLMAARRMQVAGVVTGSITRDGKRWILMFTVASGHNLEAVGSAMVPLRGARLDPSTARRIAVKIGLIMAWARAGPRMALARPRRRAADPPAPKAPPPAPTPVYSPRPRRVPTYEESRSDGEEVPVYADRASSTGTDGDEDATTDNLGFKVRKRSKRQRRRRGNHRKTRGREPWETLIEISAGMMALSRRMSFEYPQGVSALKGLPNYRSGFVPAMRLEGAVYPLINIGGPLANLGLTGRYFRAFGLQYQLQDQPSLGATLHGFELGLRHRWNILDKRTSPTLNIGLEFGRTAFVIWNDQNLNLYLPSLAYLYLKLVASLDVPVYATRTFSIGLFASFEYLPIFSAGMIAETDDAGYGPQPTGGIDVGGGLFLAYKGFFGRGSGFYRQFSYDFEHACKQGCADSGSASDVYLGFSFIVGYAY